MPQGTLGTLTFKCPSVHVHISKILTLLKHLSAMFLPIMRVRNIAFSADLKPDSVTSKLSACLLWLMENDVNKPYGCLRHRPFPNHMGRWSVTYVKQGRNMAARVFYLEILLKRDAIGRHFRGENDRNIVTSWKCQLQELQLVSKPFFPIALKMAD